MVYSIYQSEIEQLDVQIAKLRRKSNAYLQVLSLSISLSKISLF